MRAGVYCRVSTDNQEREGTSLQTQLEACREYCQDKGYEVAYLFSEAYSGLALDRPKLSKLRELVRADCIDVMVVYCLDRLSRDPTHGVILQEELEKHTVTLEAVIEDVDNSELGKLISYIRSFASKLEAERIRERTMRGKEQRVKEGVLPQGTGAGIYGYDWNRDTKRREVNPIEVDIVRQVFQRVATGESLVSVARLLNNRKIQTKTNKLWHSLTIRRMIRNTGYIGNTYFKNTLLPGLTPAIVGEDLFQAANAELDKPKVRTGHPKHDYLLRNHAFCAICGKPLVGHCLNRKYRYYQCSSARPHENNKKRCSARYVRADRLEATVWDEIKELLSAPGIILAEIQRQLAEVNDTASLDSLSAEIEDLERNLRNYELRRSNLLDALELGEFGKNEVLDRLNNVKRLRREDELRLRDIRRLIDSITNLADAHLKLGQLYDLAIENLENCTLEVKRLALDALDTKVYASTERVEIQGVIPLELPTTAQTSGCLSSGDLRLRLNMIGEQ